MLQSGLLNQVHGSIGHTSSANPATAFEFGSAVPGLPFVNNCVPGTACARDGLYLFDETRDFNHNEDTKEVSAHVKWEIVPKLHTDFDAQYVDSRVVNHDILVTAGSLADYQYSTGSSGVPQVTLLPNANTNYAAGGFSNPTNYFIPFPAILAFSNSGGSPNTYKGTHTNVLPAFNVRFGFTDKDFVRFAYSKAISRPDTGLLRNTVQINSPFINANADSPSSAGRLTCRGQLGDRISVSIAYYRHERLLLPQLRPSRKYAQQAVVGLRFIPARLPPVSSMPIRAASLATKTRSSRRAPRPAPNSPTYSSVRYIQACGPTCGKVIVSPSEQRRASSIQSTTSIFMLRSWESSTYCLCSRSQSSSRLSERSTTE